MIGNSIAGFLGTGVAVSASSYESIATLTISSASFTFSSIPQTYSHLQMRGYYIPSSSGSTASVRYNGASGTYAHLLSANASTVAATSVATTMSVESSSGVLSGYPVAFIIDIPDYASTTKNKTFRAIVGQDTNGTDAQITLSSGFKADTTAITSLGMSTLTTSATGLVALYGIKG